jgi:biopolymer transport protein ExbD
MRPLVIAILSLAACGAPDRASPRQPAAATVIPPPVATTPAVSPGIELPEVGSTGFVPADRARPQIAASPTALTVKGRVVIALTDGRASAADRGGNALGLHIPEFAAAAADLGGRPDDGLVLQLDRRLPCRTLIEILSTLRSGTHHRFALLARSGPSVVAAPLTLLDPLLVTAPRETTVSAAGKLGMLIMLKASGELSVTSLSGLEGTVTSPRLVMAPNPGIDLAQLTATLAEVRARHPAPAESDIVLMAEGSVALQTLVEVIGAVRMTQDGQPLFPDVRLSAGFE